MCFILAVWFPLSFCQDELTDLKLVTEDTIDNVATLQDCSVDQSESVQLLGENKLQVTFSHDLTQSFLLKPDRFQSLTVFASVPIISPHSNFSRSDFLKNGNIFTTLQHTLIDSDSWN